MKKKLLIVLCALCVIIASFVFAGCKASKALTLADPENVQYDGTTITWNAVENAGKYTVRIDDGKEYTVTSPSYPYVASGSNFSVTVKAISDLAEVIPSGETVKEFKALDMISELRVADDGALSWDVIATATGYLVRVDGVQVTKTFTETTYNELGEGTHSIQVRAVVEGDSSYYSLWSNPKSITKLATVDKDSISYNNGVISWSVVSGARYYEVSVNGLVTTSTCTTTEYAYDANNKDFEVTVKAIGNRTTNFDGKVSEVKKFVFLDTVTNLRVEDGSVKWDAIGGADGYLIKLNGSVYGATIKETYFDRINVNTTTEVSVKPLSEDKTYFSDWCAPKSFLILQAPVLKWNSDYELDGEANSNAYWDSVLNAAGYAVRLTKPNGEVAEFSYGETQRAFQEAFLETGTYKVEVKATAATSDSNVYDSAYSTPISVTRLDAPKPADNNYIVSDPNSVSKGFTVTFMRVDGASGYKLYKDRNLVLQGVANQFAVGNVVDASVIEEQTFNYAIQSLGSVQTIGGQINVKLSSLSEKSHSFEIKVLAVPSSPVMDGYTYTYGEIQGNNGYVVDVNGTGYTSADRTYDLSILESGEFNVKVCAKGNGAAVLSSNYTTATNVHRIAPPTNVRIDTTEASEGVLAFDPVLYAKGYYIVFDNDGNALPVENAMNINERITEQGTTVYMTSSANYYNELGTVYYMSSKPGPTANFIKLATPTFGDVAFSNTQLIWKPSANINTAIYTPTYEVYRPNGTKYNGEKNGTTMDVSYLEGGDSYTFQVKAIGDGKNYINSGKSATITIYKLATPVITRENGQYTWNSVVNGVNYVLYIDGVKAFEDVHESNKKYAYTPAFKELKTYTVSLVAVGDNGLTSINSDPCTINQTTQVLSTPDFSVAYSAETYDLNGTVNVTITTESAYATGYSYTIGGQTNTSAETTYSLKPNSVGSIPVRVYALGGNFDEQGVYYLDSQARGGSSAYTITLLATPNRDSITLTDDGYLSWPAIAGTNDYELQFSIDGGEYGESITVNKSNYTIENYAEIQSLSVKIRAKGNGTKIITSEWVEQEWIGLHS